VRAHELARELDVDNKRILQLARHCGLFLKSAASYLDDRSTNAIRAKHAECQGRSLPLRQPEPLREPARSRPMRPARPARPNPFSSVPPRPALTPPLKRERHKGTVAPLTQFMLDEYVLPRRPPRLLGAPFVDEFREAECRAREWVSHWFDDKTARAWLRWHPNLPARTAAALRQAGVTPEQAAMRVWYGKVNDESPTLADRVKSGELTAEESAEEVRRAVGVA